MGQTDRKNLGYLGEDFQYKLVHTFMEDKEFFKDLNNIIDQNMFTNAELKTYVGIMKEYYEREEAVPSYTMMGIALNEKAHNEIEKELYSEIIKKISETSSEGVEYIRELAEKFFKQQNIVKTANTILKIAGNGDTTKYEECVELLNDALTQGTREDFGNSVFDDIGETLSDDYRTAIPTGIGKIDEALEGGLGKGELGVIIGPSSFGKALAHDELVLTPNGFTEIENIKVGDNVYGRNGKQTKVLGVFPQGKRDLYRVMFSDDSYCICDLEHLWNVNSLEQRENSDNSYNTLTLKDIIENGIKKQLYRIPICDEVDISLYTEESIPHKENVDDSDFKCMYKYITDILLYSNLKFRKKIADEEIKIRLITESDEFYVLKLENYKEDSIFIRQLFASIGMTVSFSNDETTVKVYKNRKYKTIVNVTFEKNDDAICILVEDEEHLFLTRDFTVTHNTSMTTAMASFAATFKCNQNNNNGYKVLQIVFEDRIKQIQRKHIGRITGIEAKDLSKPGIIEQVKEQMDKYEDKDLLRNNLKIVRFPSGELTASHIKRYIKKLINNGFKPDLVIIDYFECLVHIGEGYNANEYEKEGKTMRKLEAMAGELDIALWIPTQGVKDSVNMELVTMDKAGGSFKKIQIAHIVMSIARTMEDIEANKATIAILKNRAGKSGKVFNNVEFNNGTCRISTDNVDEFDNMLEYNKNSQKQKNELAMEIFKMSQAKK